jgi:HEPN domain-containing protein
VLGVGGLLSKKEEEENLLRRSERFMETADYQLKRGFYDLAVFSLEQVLQLFLKAKLLANGVDYPRTHSVRALLEALMEVAQEERSAIKHILDTYLMDLGVLEDAYITSRYVMRDFRREEAERLARVVREVMEDLA